MYKKIKDYLGNSNQKLDKQEAHKLLDLYNSYFLTDIYHKGSNFKEYLRFKEQVQENLKDQTDNLSEEICEFIKSTCYTIKE